MGPSFHCARVLFDHQASVAVRITPAAGLGPPRIPRSITDLHMGQSLSKRVQARRTRACRAPRWSFKPHPKPSTTASTFRDRLASLRSRHGLLGVADVRSIIEVPRPPYQHR